MPTTDDAGQDLPPLDPSLFLVTPRNCPTCYPGGFNPDTYEGPQRDCPTHGEQVTITGYAAIPGDDPLGSLAPVKVKVPAGHPFLRGLSAQVARNAEPDPPLETPSRLLTEETSRMLRREAVRQLLRQHECGMHAAVTRALYERAQPGYSAEQLARVVVKAIGDYLIEQEH